MPLLNFQARFVDPIRAGIKHHTIRADRKVPIKVGDRLYLYCGLRHPGAYRILPEPVTCTSIQRIALTDWNNEIRATIDGIELGLDECERLAIADGFENWLAMAMFWNGRYPFYGHIIHWK